jgi:hypothetical protein
VVSKNLITEDEAEAWLQEFDELETQGSFFLSSTPVLTTAIKVS